MKYIKTIPMLGGHDKAFHIQIEHNAHIIDQFYFCTDEGISTHRSKAHMMKCLTDTGFAGFLDIKAQAIPTAQRIYNLEGIPSHDLKYLTAKLKLWTNQ